MLHHRFLAGLVLAVSLAAAPAAEAQTAAPLGQYKIDPAQTSVSGLSSGAYMAMQYHVAHSASLLGAGIVAGGPDLCAEGNPALAIGCMKILPAAAEATAATLFNQAKLLASIGQIDQIANLASSRVYLFSGKNDSVVSTGSVDAARRFYELAGVKTITYDNSLPAGHAFISPNARNSCDVNASPFVSKCMVNGQPYDQPLQVLKALYGPLNPPSPKTEQAVPFDQTAFGSAKAGMANTGYVYVPAACKGKNAQACRIHVVFHGCLQSAENPGIGDVVYDQVGYNRWAATNRIIVLYPQVAANNPLNPQTCWDWFGYTNVPFMDIPTHYATTAAPQIKAVTAMIQALAGK